jgi:hypothetical protein
MPIDSTSSAETIIRTLYEEFLNGDNGINTAIRKRNPDVPDEDLAHWIRPVPDDFAWMVSGHNRMLTWSEGTGDRGKYSRYYSIVVAEDTVLNFAFTYTTSSRRAKERELAKERIPQDIESFMRRVEVRR